MLNIKKILLPVDFPNTSLRVIHQAATLAHQFHSEILMLPVVPRLRRAAAMPEDDTKLNGWDLVEEIIRGAQKSLDHSLAPELDGLPIRSLLVKGDATQAILETAQQEKVDLIMMPSHGFAFDQFLAGSVAPKVPNGIDCPVWTDGHAEKLSAQNMRSATFSVRSISSRTVIRVCRGPCRWWPNLAPISQLLISLPE